MRAFVTLAGCAIALLVTATAVIPTRVAASPATGARLNGAFTVTMRTVSPASFRGHQYKLTWTFSPSCDVGPCDVLLSTVEATCLTASSCQDVPSFLKDASEPLTLSPAGYRGSFTFAVNCNGKTGSSYPFGYNQTSLVKLRPATTYTIGHGASAVRLVKRFAGSLELTGTPAKGYAAFGCKPYHLGLAFTATSQLG